MLTDYAAMEALKGDPLVGMFESMRILSRFPEQVQVLKSTTVVCGLSGAGSGLQRRLVDFPRSHEFGWFCRSVAAARSGQSDIAKQLQELGQQARLHMSRIEADARGFADAGVEAAHLFQPAERVAIVSARRLDPNLNSKLLKNLMTLALFLFERHPEVRRLPRWSELTNTYIFRASICSLMLGFEYASVGGVANKAVARIRNDMVDSHFATYATFFDGLMSKDDLTLRLYGRTKRVLHLVSSSGDR